MELEFILSRQPNEGGVVEVDLVDVMSHGLSIEAVNMQSTEAFFEAARNGYAVRHIRIVKTQGYVVLVLHLKKVSP